MGRRKVNQTGVERRWGEAAEERNSGKIVKQRAKERCCKNITVNVLGGEFYFPEGEGI